MRALVVLSGLMIVAAGQAAGQAGERGLARAAEGARRAWHRHDTRTLMAPAIHGIRLRVPGADPSGPVSRAQGAALLREYLAGAEEVTTTVKAARVVTSGRGYVELSRRYRVSGTSETRAQLVLLSYLEEGGTWVLVELRLTRN